MQIIYFFSVLSGNQDDAARLAATKEMISLVTSLAHTMKMIIRGALTGAFKLEQSFGNTEAVANLLSNLESMKQQDVSLRHFPSVFIGKEDTCVVCSKPVEDSCLKFQDIKWHEGCLKCTVCNLNLFPSLSSAFFTTKDKATFCSSHKPQDAVDGIQNVSQLRQYLYCNSRFVSVLYMAWSRLCELLEINEKDISQYTSGNGADSARDTPRYSSEGEEYHRSRPEEVFDEEDHDEIIPSSPAVKVHQRTWRPEPTSENSNDIYLTELTSLQLLIARQVAALALHPLVEKYFTINKLLAMIDSQKKRTMWSKMLNVMSAPKKPKSGILGKPLDVLVQESGVDSNAAYGPGTVRIPVFIDECIRALKSKGNIHLIQT
jgi:LIM domain